MIDPTAPRTRMARMALRISASSGLPLAPPKAAPAPQARASVKREILDLLGHAHPRAHPAVQSII
jgi:hypothetical protein